jgi:orotate phosphoribosyltransferase
MIVKQSETIIECIEKSAQSLHVAKLLLASGNIHWYDRKPFVFTSGTISPVYVNIRGLLSKVGYRDAVVEALRDATAPIFRSGVNVVIGGETAGIPYAALLAHIVRLPMVYVRKTEKAFGLQRQIEGGDIDGLEGLLVEDLTTDGQTKVTFAEHIRAHGCRISQTVSVFYYGVYPGVQRRLQGSGLKLTYLCDWQDILQAAEDHGGLPTKNIDDLAEFLDNPTGWRPRD